MVFAIILIGAGTGGIKANVSTFVADQTPGCNEKVTGTIFRIFYFCINLGSIGGTFITPLLHQFVGYWAAFLIPTIMFILSIIVFCIGKNKYIQPELRGNILMKFYEVCCSAYRNRAKDSREKSGHWLDPAKNDNPAQLVEDFKDVLVVSKVFVILPIYWALYQQQSNVWVYQAALMNLHLGNYTLTADQPQIINPVFIVIVMLPMIWFFNKLHDINKPLRPIPRIIIGYIIAAFAFVVSAIVQTKIDASPPNSVSILWQIPQLCLIAYSEIFASTTSLELAYSEAPSTMKSIVMAFYLMTSAIGSAIIMAIGQLLKRITLVLLFWVLAGCMLFFVFVFWFFFRKYKYKSDRVVEQSLNVTST